MDVGTLYDWDGRVIGTEVPEPEVLTYEEEVILVHGVEGKEAVWSEVEPILYEVPATYDEDGNELTPYQPATYTESVLLEPAVEHVEEVKETYTRQMTWEMSHSTPVFQAIDQSKLVPLLTAGLQEALAKIEELEARLSELEGN